MKRKLLICILTILATIACSIGIAACNSSNNGTYYLLKYDGTLDTSCYIKLDGGNWEDDDGEKGTYKTDGDKIRLYVTLFGENEILAEGTVADGVLSLDIGGGMKEVYITETHEHKFGEWETVNYNCLTDGLQRRTCACGFKEEQTLTAVGHHTYGEWVTVQEPCANDGLKRRTCICGDYEEEAIPATGEHNFGEWVVTKEPGLSSYGTQTRTCNICHETETAKIDRIAEDYYSLFEKMIETENYAYCIISDNTKTLYQINGEIVLINEWETYLYREEGVYYRLEFNTGDGKYHKVFGSSYNVDEIILNDLKNLTISAVNTDSSFSVTINDESYTMTVENVDDDRIIKLINSDVEIKISAVGETNIAFPREKFIIDETI